MSLSPCSPSTKPSSKYAGKSANAIAQSRHREKKKSYVTGLEQDAAKLKAENDHLRVELEQLKLQLLKTRDRSHRTRRGPSSSSSLSTSTSDAVLREREKEREINRLSSLILEMGGATFPPSTSFSAFNHSTLSSSHPTSSSSSHGPLEAWSNSPADLALLASVPVQHRHLVSPQYWTAHPFAAPSFGGSDASSSSTSYPSSFPSHLPSPFRLHQHRQSHVSSSPFLGEGAGTSGGGGDEGLTSRSPGLATLSVESLTTEFDASGEMAPLPLSFVDFASSPESDGYRTGDSTTSEDSLNFFDPQSHGPLYSPLSSPELDAFQSLAPWPLGALSETISPPSRTGELDSSCLPAFSFSLS